MDPYLLGLRLRGRLVVVVGGGAVASRRVPSLLDAGAEILLVSPEVAASLEDLAAAGRIRAGTVTVNGGGSMLGDHPWGGYKQSGLGREGGVLGFAEFFETKHILWPLDAPS